MFRISTGVVIALLAVAPAFAFDDASQSVIDESKVGKLVPIDNVAALMMGAERWCYNQDGNNCAWSDVYISADDDGAVFEISNPWSETVDISYVNRGEFRDNRYICEVGFDWVPSVRAYTRGDGWALEGRELAALREEITAAVDTPSDSACYDYVFRGYDAANQTITLLQRDFASNDGEVLGEATVTLHFDKVTADDLGWYW